MKEMALNITDNEHDCNNKWFAFKHYKTSFASNITEMDDYSNRWFMFCVCERDKTKNAEKRIKKLLNHLKHYHAGKNG